MSVDWSDVFAAAVDAAVSAAKAKQPIARTYIRQIFEAREVRMRLLLAALADGAMDEDSLDDEMEEERRIARMELLAITVLEKKAAQDAANAFFKVVSDALLKGIAIIA